VTSTHVVSRLTMVITVLHCESVAFPATRARQRAQEFRIRP